MKLCRGLTLVLAGHFLTEASQTANGYGDVQAKAYMRSPCEDCGQRTAILFFTLFLGGSLGLLETDSFTFSIGHLALCPSACLPSLYPALPRGSSKLYPDYRNSRASPGSPRPTLCPSEVLVDDS